MTNDERKKLFAQYKLTPLGFEPSTYQTNLTLSFEELEFLEGLCLKHMGEGEQKGARFAKDLKDKLVLLMNK